MQGLGNPSILKKKTKHLLRAFLINALNNTHRAQRSYLQRKWWPRVSNAVERSTPWVHSLGALPGSTSCQALPGPFPALHSATHHPILRELNIQAAYCISVSLSARLWITRIGRKLLLIFLLTFWVGRQTGASPHGWEIWWSWGGATLDGPYTLSIKIVRGK